MAKILLVDDEIAIREILKVFLEEKHDLIEARDGVEAVELYKTEKPDLVIMDIRMPRLGGIDAIKKIKEMNSKTKIIVLSAYASKQSNQILASGADEVLEKPLRRNRILEAINKYLE